jgi:hypothetical protein
MIHCDDKSNIYIRNNNNDDGSQLIVIIQYGNIIIFKYLTVNLMNWYRINVSQRFTDFYYAYFIINDNILLS